MYIEITINPYCIVIILMRITERSMIIWCRMIDRGKTVCLWSAKARKNCYRKGKNISIHRLYFTERIEKFYDTIDCLRFAYIYFMYNYRQLLCKNKNLLIRIRLLSKITKLLYYFFMITRDAINIPIERPYVFI